MRVVLFLVLLLLVGCSPRPVTVATSTPGATPAEAATPLVQLELREVTEEGERPPRPQVSPLAPEEVEKLLASLEPLPRPSPSPAARPAVSPPAVPLRPPPPLPEPSPGETRVYPEGEVKFADRVAVSFGKPAAPLGAPPPTDWKITPDVPGAWRWLGTKTLLFEPKDERFPMATEYAVEGPELKWKFSTPAPDLESSSPEGEGQKLTPTIQLVFNQKVTPTAVLEFLSLRADVRTYPLRLATAAEVAALEPEVVPGTRVVVLPEQPLPSSTDFKLFLKEGLPSAEGPLKKPAMTFISFRTYDALKLDHQHISHQWRFSFNNQLDEEEPLEVNIEPALPGQKTFVSSNVVIVTEEAKAGTRYQVSFPGLKDVHGQSYTGEPVTVVPQPGEPLAWFPAGTETSLEPDGPGLEFASTGYPRVTVERFLLTDEEVATLVRTDVFAGKRKPTGRETLKLDPKQTTRQRLKLPRGQWVVRLRAGKSEPDDIWVQVTDLNAVVWRDARKSQVWVTRLGDSRPVDGARVNGIRTDARGLATLPDRLAPIRVQAGTDVCWARPASSVAPLKPRWYVADDRSLYRPGETVHVHGWVRKVAQDLELATGEVEYRLKDANLKNLAKGNVQLHGQGSFQLELKLPAKMASGNAMLVLQRGHDQHEHVFRIEEFRRSDFEVSLSADPRPVVVGSSARAEVLAQTFSGGSLAGSAVNWDVTASPTDYAPPGWDEYQFGNGEGPEWRRKLRGSADQQGTDKVELTVKSLPPTPYRAQLTAEVQDLSRQTESRDTTMTLLPAEVCLGLRGPDWLAAGENCTVQAIVTDPEGKAVAGRPVRLRWLENDKQASQDELTSADTPGAAHYQPSASGLLVLEAETEDAKGRAFRTSRRFWVGGSSAGGREPRLDVQLDKSDYKPGEKATLQVRTQLEGPTGMVVVRHGDITQSHPLTITNGRATLEVPLTEADVPGLQLDVAVRGRKEKEAVLETDSVLLPVSSASRKLTVKVTPGKTVLSPGGNTSVTVSVTDAEEKPVRAELWAVAVDESVLAAAGTDGPGDPLGVFYAPWHESLDYYPWPIYLTKRQMARSHYRWEIGGGDTQIYVTGHYAHTEYRSDTTLPSSAPGYVASGRGFGLAGAGVPYFNKAGVYPGGVAGSGNGQGGVGSLGGTLLNPDYLRGQSTNATVTAQYQGVGARISLPAGHHRKPRLRRNFSPLALSTRVLTDAEGRASIPLKLPDNLTRYKIIVVAASGATQFGLGEASVTAALPLTLRLAAPRFTRPGDRYELKAILANQGLHTASVRLAVRGQGMEPQGFRLELKPDERAEVPFPTEGPGPFQAVATSSEGADQTQLALPLQSAATTVELATYGQLDQPEGLQLDLPKDALDPSLTVDLSTSPRGQLRGAVDALVRDGFDTGTRAAALVLAGSHWPEAVPRPVILTALERLKGLQTYSGALANWAPHNDDDPQLTLLAAQALLAARKAGLPVDQRMLAELTNYVREEFEPPSSWPIQDQQMLSAYRLDTLKKLGHPDPAAARKLARQKDLPLAAVGWLLPTLPNDQALKKRLVSAVREEAGTATFSTGMRYEKNHWVLANDRETDAILLDALVQVNPKLAIPVARGLAQARYLSESATALAVVAVSKLPNPAPRTTEVWADGQQLLAPPGRTRLPGADAVVLGASQLYYRLGLHYSTASPLPPADLGFALERRYEAVDDNRDVSNTTVEAGALVRVRLTIVCPVDRYRVALVDPLPAGLEVVNPALAGTVRREDKTASDSWWFGHHNLRDDRVEAFAEELPAGVYTYSYLARATTTGTFLVPPATCHELGNPEISGRTESTQMEVK